jgi:hypothetical protein
MQITALHRRAAKALWDAGGRIDEAARASRLAPERLRRWLAEPAFRALVAQAAAEPLLQAASAVIQWAPVAVARLIRDLDGESASDARQAAREVLRLAMEARRDLADAPAPDADALADAAGHSVSRRVAALSDDQLARVLAILDEAPEGGAHHARRGCATAGLPSRADADNAPPSARLDEPAVAHDE